MNPNNLMQTKPMIPILITNNIISHVTSAPKITLSKKEKLFFYTPHYPSCHKQNAVHSPRLQQRDCIHLKSDHHSFSEATIQQDKANKITAMTADNVSLYATYVPEQLVFRYVPCYPYYFKPNPVYPPQLQQVSLNYQNNFSENIQQDLAANCQRKAWVSYQAMTEIMLYKNRMNLRKMANDLDSHRDIIDSSVINGLKSIGLITNEINSPSQLCESILHESSKYQNVINGLTLTSKKLCRSLLSTLAKRYALIENNEYKYALYDLGNKIFNKHNKLEHNSNTLLVSIPNSTLNPSTYTFHPKLTASELPMNTQP